MWHACSVFLADFTLSQNRTSNCVVYLRYFFCWYLHVALVVIMENNGFKMRFVASVFWWLLQSLTRFLFFYKVLQKGP